MGCSDSKEKLEDQMLNLQISRIELQMERYKQLQLLKEEKGIEPNFPKIPDYIDQKFAINQSKRNSMSTNIKEVKNNPIKRRSKSFKTKRVTIIIFIVGILITCVNYNNMKKPATLAGSSIKATTESRDIELNAAGTIIEVPNDRYEIMLDPSLEDNKIRAEVTYYDDYVDVYYDQETIKEDNHLYFYVELDKEIDTMKKIKNVVKDLKKGYIFDYSETRQIKVNIYANEETKQELIEMNK